MQSTNSFCSINSLPSIIIIVYSQICSYIWNLYPVRYWNITISIIYYWHLCLLINVARSRAYLSCIFEIKAFCYIYIERIIKTARACRRLYCWRWTTRWLYRRRAAWLFLRRRTAGRRYNNRRWTTCWRCYYRWGTACWWYSWRRTATRSNNRWGGTTCFILNTYW